jgi:NitT/TauT family transport system substrate-binding protein
MRVIAAILMSLAIVGCDRKETSPANAPGTSPKVRLALNWVPEPEFGGFYAAQQAGDYKAANLNVEILPAAAGAPTWQIVGAGQVEFGIASADEVVIARTRGADVVAVFAVYQTCPQGIMVHKSRGLTSLADVFKSGTLAVENGLPYLPWLQKKYDTSGVKMVTYSGGITEFLADKNYAQQCFVTSEPLAAARQGSDPQTFLIADSGYNPYTAVIITRASYARDNRATVDAFVAATTKGWQKYLTDPSSANQFMATLNKDMDLQTFADVAKTQEKLIQPEGLKDLGSMTEERWRELIEQLVQLKVIPKPLPPGECFLH